MENTKVRYSVDGSYYDIPSDKVEDFERDTPQARQVYRVGEDTYAIPLDKRDGFTAQYPDAEYWNGGRVNSATEPMQQPTLSDQGQQATVTPQPQQEQKQGFWARLGKNLSQAESSPQGMGAPEQNVQPQAEQKTDLPENWEERSAEFDTDYDNFSKVINAKLAEKTDVYKQRSMERENRMGKFLSGIVNAGQAEGGAITPQAREEIAAGGDEEADQLRAASQLFDNAKKTKDAAYKQKGILSGLADSATADTWDFGITDMKTAQQVYKLAQKIENNEELTENDNLLMEAMLQNAFANEYYSGQLRRGYKAGQVTGESLPFMLEFLMNPLAGGEKAASGGAIKVLEKSLAKKMAQRAERAAVKSAEKTALKTALEKGGELAMKGLARGADDLLSAAGMAATTGSIRTLEDTYSRKTGNVKFHEDPDGGLVFDGFAGGESNWWKAAAKAYGATTIEDFSEMFGNYFRPIGQTAKKGMYFINKWAGLEKVNNFIDGIGAKDWARATSEFLKRTEWNGPISEFNEELVGGVMNAIFIGDQKLDGSDPNGVFNRDNLIDTFLGVAVFGGVVSAMKTAGYSREAQQNSKMRSEAVITGEQSFGEDWSRIQKQIDGADEQAVKQIVLTAFEPGSEYTPEQKQAIVKYAGVRMVQIGLEKGRQKKEEYINEGINEGKTLTAPQEINQQDIEGEYNRERAARETASEGEPTAASELGVEHADAVQQGRREAMQSNIEEGVGQQFWKSEDIVRPAEDGQSAETVQEDVVDVITYPDGREEYVVSESDGTLATVDATGKRGFATEAQIQENQGVRSSVPLNTYLDTKVGEQSMQAEQQRMAQDAANNLAAIQQRVQEEGQINVGTPENEQMATVIDMLRDPAVGGVVVQVEGEQQPRTLSWREVATAYGMPLEPKSNAQIVNERINAEEEVEKYNNGITQDAELVVPMEGENAIYQFRYAEDIDGDVIIRAYDPVGGQEVDLTPEMVENLDALLNGNTPTAPVADVQGNPVPEVEVQPAPTDIFDDPAANALGISSDYAYTTKRGTVVVDGSKLWAENPTLWAEWNDRNENRVIPTKEYLEGKLQEIDKEVETARANLEEEARGSQNPDRMDDLQDILDKKTARQREVRGLVSKYEAAEATAAEMQQAAEAQQEAQEAAHQSIVGEEQAAPATAEEILASTQAALDTVDQQMAQVRSAEDYRLAMEAKAEALQQMFDALGAENTVVSTRADIVEVFRAAGGSEANARALAEKLRLTAGKERLRGFYNNGKIFIIADDIRGAEDANVTQLHEAKHLENAATGAVNEGLRTGVTTDEMRTAIRSLTRSNSYDEESRRALADEVLANAEEIAEREGVEAIPQRLAEAGIVNGEFINFVQNNINNGRRGSQRRHLGGRHALQSVDSEVSGREDVRDTQPQPAAVEGQGLRPDAGGEQGAGGAAEQPAEPAGEPGLAEEPAPQSAEEAETTREITANIGGRIEEEGGEAPTLFSITAGAEGVGLNATEADESGNVVFMSKDGRVFDGHNPITAEDLKNEPNTVMGFMMADALKYGTITPEQADTIWQKYADILNRMLEKGLAENGGFDNLSSQWQWVGETVFKTIHDNSDAQYKHSIDITRVCKKNEAVIKSISALQRRLGYGITPGQIMDIYRSSIEEGYQVPCPVCYVFSRYIGNGYIATVAINGQKKYGSRLVDPSTLTDEEKREAIRYWVKELDRVEAKNKKYKKKISQAKKDIQTILDEIDGLSRKALDKSTPEEEKKQALDQIKALDKQYKAALNVVSQSNLAKWIKNFAIHKVGGEWRLYDDTFQGFPAEYALDIRLTADAIRKYPGIQRMRKSLGSAGGKVIQFAANNDIGDVLMLLGHSESDKAQNYYKLAAEAETEADREALLEKASAQFGKALTYAQQQSLRGGQRMWSWSDNIERLAPDVFFNLMQMEMLGGALQSYSKQLEGINLVANMGGYVNGSLMGKGIGYQDVTEDQVEVVDGREVLKEDITDTVTEYDGDGANERTRVLAQAGSPIFSDGGRRVVLVFDDVVGVDPYGKNGKKGLFDLNLTLDKAGNILVGMDDTHIRAAMADDRVFFIIPWHKSGLSSHILAQMMEYLGVDTSEFDPKDYTNVQEEKDPADGNVTPELVSFWEAHKNETDFPVGFGRSIPSGRDGKLSQEQIDYRNLRDAIFDGRVDENPKFLKAVMRDAFLSQVYEKVKERVAVGKMTAGDKKYVYPYEYWDESSTYATADVNGARYLEYCRRLGIKPKFVGKLDANAKEDFGNFADDKGYWKLLIDRRMYDVNGNFQDLTPVTTDNFTPDLVDPEMTEQEFEVTKVADDTGVERIADRTMELEENRPGGMATVDYDMDLDRAVRDYDRLSLSVVGGEETQLTDAQRFAYEFVNGTPAVESQAEETDIRPSMVGMDALDKDGVVVDNEAMLNEYGLSHLTLTKKGDVVTVNRVEAAEQGQGAGTRFMNELVAEADKNGWTLALTPDDTFGATSVSRLKKFYKRFGFKENKGSNTDFTINESMVRVPDSIRYSIEQEEAEKTNALFDAAKERFGTTRDIREAGYVLPDGTMLDFSGRHWLAPGSDSSYLAGDRHVDHRDIADLEYERDGNTPTGIETSMTDFIRRGAIRINDGSGASINLAVKPTPEQASVLTRLIEHNNGDVYLDLGDGERTDASTFYEGAKARRVINDIKRYFDEGVAPEGGINFSIRGILGAAEDETAMANLDTAKQMEADGKDAKTIWLATGWEKGADGKWRNEIPDATPKPFGLSKRSLKVEDIVDAPELFASYPDMKDYKVSLKKMSGAGAFNPKEKEIEMDRDYNTTIAVRDEDQEAAKEYFRQRWAEDPTHPADIRKDTEKKYGVRVLDATGLRTVMHELQHAIQDIEGFARGGNSKAQSQDYLSAAYKRMPEVVTFARAFSSRNSAARLLRYGRAKMINYIDRNINDFGGADEREMMSELRDYLAGIDDYGYRRLVNDAAGLWKVAKEQGNERYNRLAGEVEARNVERRMSLTEEKRRETPISATEDVAREEQGVRFSVVTDPAKIEELENGGKELGYRTVTMNEDGSFGSPKASKLGKKGEKSVKTSSFNLNEWEQSEENPQLATDDGKINLADIGGVDYNPYIHIRPDAINKQFTSAWRHPEQVYIQTSYPTSELSSGYHAEKAKLPVGRHAWTNGDLILSRWDKPERIVPWEEVADAWEQEFKDTGVTFDIVSPNLLPILAERGVEILPPKKAAGKPAMDAYERWKKEQESPRFSVTAEQDQEYMDAVNAGDMEKAQRMVEEAAKAAMPETVVVDGNYTPRVVLHGTNAEFNVFDERKSGSATDPGWLGRGFYFYGNNPEYASQYGRRIVRAFLNIENPYFADYEDIKRLSEENSAEASEEFRQSLIDEGYDGVNYNGDLNDEWVAFYPSQIKSADPVTYDDSGNVIPLSERFNPDNDDIRFSVQGETESLFDRYDKQDGEQYPWMSEDELIDRIEEEIPYGVASRPLYAKIDEYRRLDEEDFDEGRRDFSGGEKDEVFQEILSELQKYEKGADQQSLRFSIANENQSIFVSNAENAVRMIQMGKATPEQWQKMIEKNGGLKAGEDKWLGLSDWLKASDRKSITKQEILDFIDQNKIRIEETRYAENPQVNDEIAQIAYRINDRYDELASEDLDMDEIYDTLLREFPEMEEMEKDGRLVLDEDAIGTPMYRPGNPDIKESNKTRLYYTTNGLSNKKEIALTVPTIEKWNESDSVHFGDAGEGRAVAWVRFGDAIDTETTVDREASNKALDAQVQMEKYINEMMQKYGFRRLDDMPMAVSKEEWKEYQRLASEYRKLSDAVNVEEKVNKKVLFIDEIQSKRHQEGRDIGYNNKDAYKSAKVDEFRKFTVDDEEFEEADVFGRGGVRLGKITKTEDGLFYAENEDGTKVTSSRNTIEDALKAMDDAFTKEGIPSAPFEKNWHELAMKRMLRLAAEEGYDYVAWTTGDQQAERYNLGNVVSKISVFPDNEFGGRQVIIRTNSNDFIDLDVDDKGIVENGEYRGKPLSDVLGKDLASKIIADTENSVYEGDGLRIGGEGMKGFYDEILPRFVNKYAKKWGVKVEDINLPNLESNGITAHAIPVTEEMKESVMEGQLMFSVQAVEEQEDRQRLIGAVDNGGLEAVLGDEGAQEFYRDAYISIPESELRKIVEQGLAEGGNIYAQLRAYMHKLAQDGTENDPTGLLFKLFDDVRYMTANAALTDSDIRYIIWKGTSTTDPGDILAIAEASAMRKRWGVGEMPMEQQFREATEIAAENTEERLDAAKRNLKEEKKQTYGPLEAINRAMAAQKTYDKETVDSIVKFAKEIMKNGGVSALTLREANRLLSLINNSTGKSPKFVTRYADQLMDMLLEHIVKEEAAKFDKLVKVKANKVSSSGVEVQGKLDIVGQAVIKAFRENMNSPVEDIRSRMEDATERMDDKDDAIREEAMAAYSGLMLALQYKEKIADNEEEYKDLKREFNEVSVKLPQLIGRKAYDEFIASSKEALRKNLMERVDMYRELSRKLTEMIGSSAERAAEFRKAEQARIEDIHHDANRDMQGVSTREHRRDTAWQRFLNSDFVRFFLKSLATGDQMFRMLGRKSVDGQGFLYNRYIKNGFTPASERAARGMFDAFETLDAKVSEVFDKPGMKWSDLYRIERKLPGMTVSFLDGGEMIDHELTQGNMLYIYMANKMTDGKMKLRKMGISEEDVQAIKKNLDPRFVELADWMQDEFYVNLRNKYNEVHERMFGAPMAAIEDYVPIKILSNARFEDVDLGSDQSQAELSSTITGSIIKRRRNSLALDILHTDAFSLAIEHVEKMEDWAAFAELRRDINTLLSYKHFRNQVQNMNTVYGSGKTLWNNFKDVCKVTIGKYQPKVKAGDIDTMALNVGKGVTAAKIAFRVNTAIKQLLSFPAYLSDARIDYLAKSLATPGKSWKWCMENLPLFEKRWKSRIAGDTRLLDTDSDWKIWKDNVVKTAARLGMTPNAFVDATTVAIGAKAMYDTKKAQYLKDGYSEEKADDMAKKDAEILYNQTQQSSENAFVSPVQLDRTVMAVTLTTYRNSSMAYQRQLHDAIRSTARMMKPGYREMSIAFMTRQNIANGLTEEQAQRAAERQYNRQWYRNLARVAIFGYGLQFLWKIGNDMWYLLFGDDDDEKQKILEEAALAELAAPLEGLVAGNVISDAWGSKVKEIVEGKNGIKQNTRLDKYGLAQLPLVSDMKSILNELSYDKSRAVNDIINLVVQSGVGVNPQTLSDAVVALIDYTNGDVFDARELAFFLMRVAQLPQSTIEKFLIDEIDMDDPEKRKEETDRIAKRYAVYKVMKNAPLTQGMYDDETMQKRLKAAEKSFRDKVASRIKVKENAGEEVPETAEDIYKRVEKESKAFQTDLNRAKKDNDTLTINNLMAQPEYQQYLIWKKHQKGINKLNNSIKKTDDDALRQEWEAQLRDSIQTVINELNENK